MRTGVRPQRIFITTKCVYAVKIADTEASYHTHVHSTPYRTGYPAIQLG